MSVRKVLSYLKPYIFFILIIFSLVAIRAILDLQFPYYMGLIFDTAESSLLSNQQKTDKIFEYASLMGLITILTILIAITSGFIESKVSARFGMALRRNVYTKIQSFTLTELDKINVSSLITRTTNDIALVQGTVNMLLRMIILSPVMAVAAISMAISLSPTLSLVIIGSVMALLVLVITLFLLTMPRFKIIQKLVDKLNLVTRENLTGLKVVRAFNTRDYQEGKIEKTADEYRKINVFVNRLFSLMWPLAALVMGLTGVGMVLVTVNFDLIDINGFTVGDLSALVQYAARTIMAFMSITMILIQVPRAVISARRIAEVLNLEVAIKDCDNPIDLVNPTGLIEFKNVTFSYPNANEPVLYELNFTCEPNKVTAIIGSTGSGKSTLVNLIPRFYDTTNGEILIDGINLKEIRLKSLYQNIGYIPQKALLFKGTIKDNVLYSDISSESDLQPALAISQSLEFVNNLDDKENSLISQGGSNVSGGQRQRLSIARALAKKSKILIFDDSFSALDYKTDKNLRNALKENVKATILIVAQRVNTIKEADQIIVLDNGRIEAIGTHHELLNNSKVYQEIAFSQLSKEELENA